MKKVILLTFVLLVFTGYSQTKTINQQFADLQIEYKLQQKELQQLKTKIEEVEKQSDKNFSTYQNVVMVGLAILTLIFGVFGILAPLWINNNVKENIRIMNEANNKLIDDKITRLKEKLNEVDNVLSTVTQQLAEMENIKQKVLELQENAEKSAKQSEVNRLFIEALKEEDIDKKIKLYTKVLKLNPEYAESYNNRGVAYADKGEYDKAKSDYDNAIKINPQFEKAYTNRGNIYADKGENDKAILDYNKAIECNSQFVEAYINRGNIYAEKGEYHKAKSDYDNVIKINPKFEKAYINRGNIYSLQKKYDKAILDYNKAIELNPEYAESYNNRAQAYRGLEEQYPEKSAEYIKLAEADEAQAKKLKSINQ